MPFWYIMISLTIVIFGYDAIYQETEGFYIIIQTPPKIRCPMECLVEKTPVNNLRVKRLGSRV
jgi:hypothetical protein